MIEYVCFNITSFCNMNCQFCYRVGTTFGNMSYEDAKRYIDKLILQGCKTINITGGEPLLNPQWRDIINYCHKRNLFIILSTNGYLLELSDPILKKIQVLSLPLDSAYEDTNDIIRIKGHYEKIKRIINQYCRCSYPFKLKINTVISQYNVNDLHEMLNIINDYRITWKLFGLREKGHFYHFLDQYKVTDNGESIAISELMKSPHCCSIFYMNGTKASNDITLKTDYIVVNYNGDVYLSTIDNDILLSNMNDECFKIKTSSDNINNQYHEEFNNAV